MALAGTVAASGCFLFPSDNSVSLPPTPDKHALRVDSVGYLPARAKLATLVKDPGGANFEIHDAADASKVWDGPLSGPVTDQGGADGGAGQVWIADFTSWTTPGRYYLEVPNVGQSATFTIADDVFKQAFTVGMLGLYTQRCGTAVNVQLDVQSGDTMTPVSWSHGICHTNDAYLTHLIPGNDTIKPSLRGWHDAGDYGKYITNGAFTVGMLLEAWDHFQAKLQNFPLTQIPEHGGAIPDFLAEVKWELDWLLTTQGDDGSVSHKVTALVFEGFVVPEGDGSLRFYSPVGTVAAGDFTAVMAMAARIYMPYDAAFASTCLAAAQKSYAYLMANPTIIQPDQSAFSTGGYNDGTDADERLWAAAEMWETTGDASFLTTFEAGLSTRVAVSQSWDWPNTQNFGYFTYLLSQKPGRDPAKVAALTTAAVTAGGNIVTTARNAPYGRGLGAYYWGSNGSVARQAMNLWVAYQLDNQDPKYLDGIAMQLDHLLGRNYYDRSQVTDLGNHPPINPHHRLSAGDNVAFPWPGLLVGGSWPGEASWTDNQSDFNTNEVAINWIGAFVYATAALLPNP